MLKKGAVKCGEMFLTYSMEVQCQGHLSGTTPDFLKQEFYLLQMLLWTCKEILRELDKLILAGHAAMWLITKVVPRTTKIFMLVMLLQGIK